MCTISNYLMVINSNLFQKLDHAIYLVVKKREYHVLERECKIVERENVICKITQDL